MLNSTTSDTPQTITLDGSQLIYRTAGDPALPPLIMIHGWTSYQGVWNDAVETLKDHYYCITLDLLGHGYSDKPKNADYSIEAQARRVLALADSLGFERFSLMGHSMGGQISLCIAGMLAPERVERLVDVSGVAAAKLMPAVEWLVYPVVWLTAQLPWLMAVHRWVTAFRPAAWFYFGRAWYYDIRRIPREVWYQDSRYSYQAGAIHAYHACGQAIHNLDVTPHLPRIQADTLIIFGKQDRTVPISDAHLAAARIPHSQLTLFDECGHFPMVEYPQKFNEALGEFFGF
ncbi:MAG: alpha/beta hydrolase [Anaerolineaceae bacterium]|nr:alpha/beta hydrolase [Anaerolineaceae bacterium]